MFCSPFRVRFSAHKAQEIPSRISIIHDGWSTKCHRLFSSICIQYIHSAPETPRIWTLKNHLLDFKRTIGRHTGVLVGQELVDVVGKFGFMSKVSFCILIQPLPDSMFLSLVQLLGTIFLLMMWQSVTSASSSTPRSKS